MPEKNRVKSLVAQNRFTDEEKKKTYMHACRQYERITCAIEGKGRLFIFHDEIEADYAYRQPRENLT